MPRFENKTVIVTGAAGGIGLATAVRFAQEGARVAVIDLHSDEVEEAAGKVREAGAAEVLAVTCDVTEPAQVRDSVGRVLDRCGSLDVIVNNAGVMTFKPLPNLTTDDWLQVLRVDLLGAFLFIQQGLRHMQRGASIVNVSSIHARETEPLVAPYAASKAALLSLTRSAAIEGKPRGIRVNAVLPGAVDTPMLWDNPNVKSGAEEIDPADVGQVEDVAAAIAFLASDDAAFVQGANLVVDGGRLDQL